MISIPFYILVRISFYLNIQTFIIYIVHKLNDLEITHEIQVISFL